MNLEKIGTRIKSLRRNRKLTQEQFAEMINVSPHYIYEIERGTKTMSLYTLDDISRALAVSADYLLYGDNGEGLEKYPDRLHQLTEQLPPDKRDKLADLLTLLLPYLSL